MVMNSEMELTISLNIITIAGHIIVCLNCYLTEGIHALLEDKTFYMKIYIILN